MQILSSNIKIADFIKSNQIVIVYFTTEGCNVCKVLLPKIEEMLKNYPKVKLGKVDISKTLEAAGEYSVFSFPTILLYIDGKEFSRESRYLSIESFESTINKYYKLLFD